MIPTSTVAIVGFLFAIVIALRVVPALYWRWQDRKLIHRQKAAAVEAEEARAAEARALARLAEERATNAQLGIDNPNKQRG